MCSNEKRTRVQASGQIRFHPSELGVPFNNSENQVTWPVLIDFFTTFSSVSFLFAGYHGGVKENRAYRHDEANDGHQLIAKIFDFCFQPEIISGNACQVFLTVKVMTREIGVVII